MRIARSRQVPGQTKEQTKLIALGIQKGIEQYKRQQSEKARELDRRLKQQKQTRADVPEPQVVVQEAVRYKQHWLPWLLLLLTWLGVAVGAYYFVLD
jgi:hypothetical protein